MGVSICFHSDSGTAFHSASDFTTLLMFPFTPAPPLASACPDAATLQARPAPREPSAMRTSRRVRMSHFTTRPETRPPRGQPPIRTPGGHGHNRLHLRSMSDTLFAREVPLVGRHLRHPRFPF